MDGVALHGGQDLVLVEKRDPGWGRVLIVLALVRQDGRDGREKRDHREDDGQSKNDLHGLSPCFEGCGCSAR